MIRMGPGRKLICIPDSGVTVLSPGGGAAAVDWWNAGGCPNSVWADVWTFKGAASYAAAKIGNVNGMVMAEGNGAVPWDVVNGMKFTAASAQWLDTGITPTSTYGLIVQFSGVVNVGASFAALCGEFTNNARLFIYALENGANNVLYGDGQFIRVAPQLLAGNLAITNQRGYRNGVADGAAIGAWTAAATATIYIGGNNQGGVLVWPLTGNIQAIGIPKVDISTYVAALSVAMAAL